MRDKDSKRVSKIFYGISFFIFLIILLWGIFFLDDGGALGYVIMNFSIIMPITSLVMGIILGIKDAYLKWGYPILFGLLGIIIPAIVFRGSWDWFYILYSLIPSLLGLTIGILLNKFRRKA